ISYKELRELSYMGATVLHEDAIFPVRKAGIHINIKNTNKPEDIGTMIVADDYFYETASTVTGIAGKKGFSVISIEKDMMNNELGFGRRVLQVLENHKVSFEHLPSSIDTMCVVVPTSQIETIKSDIVLSLKDAVKPDSIEIIDGLALIAIVGKGMVKSKGTAARVTKSVYDSGVNIKMIDQGSGEFNIIIGVDENDFEKTIKGLYLTFFKK
ncbi:MAG: aspartate kinase, partial [Oscillospiraceae bacterium]